MLGGNLVRVTIGETGSMDEVLKERERKRDGVDGVRAISLVYALRPKFQFSG